MQDLAVREPVAVPERHQRQRHVGHLGAQLDLTHAGHRTPHRLTVPLLPRAPLGAPGLEDQVPARPDGRVQPAQGGGPVHVGDEDLGDVAGHHREVDLEWRQRGRVAVQPSDRGGAGLGAGQAQRCRGGIQTGHRPALSGEQQREGPGAAPDVENPVGAQLRDQPEVRRQVVAVAVEDVVQAGQAGIGEQGVGHGRTLAARGR